MRIPITVSVEERVVKEVDERRGLTARSRYVEALLKDALKGEREK